MCIRDRAMDRDAAEIRKTYEDAGLPCDVNKELAAAATEKLMASLGAWGRTCLLYTSRCV